MEIDFLLKALLPRAEKLTKLGFGKKVKVLHAAWIGETETGDTLCDALYRFNELRNAIAHFDSKQVDSCLAALYVRPTLGSNAEAQIKQKSARSL